MTHQEKIDFIKEHGRRRDFLTGGERHDGSIWGALWDCTIVVEAGSDAGAFSVGEHFTGLEEMFDEEQMLAEIDSRYSGVEPYSPEWDQEFGVVRIDRRTGRVTLQGGMLA